jgi:mannose-6-phosphate isomerase-like protein (cupin superfamily)
MTPVTQARAGDTTTGERRRIVNPVQDDIATFLETSEESGGQRTLAELDVAPGGKVTPHRHMTYTESFRVLQGRLRLRIGDTELTLAPGEEATVPVGALHAWANPSAERVVAHVELRPGQPGFETALRIAYGLAADGLVLRNGMPRNPLHAALLLEWGDSRLPGAYAVLERALRLLARIARRTGVDRDLLQRYP